MTGSGSLQGDSGGSWPEKARAALGAGLVYFALLLAVGVAFGAISEIWLMPQVGAGSAFAIELTFMFPAAWVMNGSVARYFGIESAWPMGAIVAGTTVVLLCIADLALLTLLDPILVKSILNHGWAEARFVTQILMSALPLVYRAR